MNDADRLDKHARWLLNTSYQLAKLWHIDSDDCHSMLAAEVILGRSHRLAYLRVCTEIKNNYTRRSVVDGESFQSLLNHGSDEIELVTRMMDLELILDADEMAIVRARVEGRDFDEIGESLGVQKGSISKRLKAIRKKIMVYYAS